MDISSVVRPFDDERTCLRKWLDFETRAARTARSRETSAGNRSGTHSPSSLRSARNRRLPCVVLISQLATHRSSLATNVQSTMHEALPRVRRYFLLLLLRPARHCSLVDRRELHELPHRKSQKTLSSPFFPRHHRRIRAFESFQN